MVLERWKIGLIVLSIVIVILVVILTAVLVTVSFGSVGVADDICVSIQQLVPTFTRDSALVLSCFSGAAYERFSPQIRDTLKKCCILSESYDRLKRFHDSGTDTFGFCATIQNPDGGIGIIIAFKGSESFTDVETDLDSFRMTPFPDTDASDAMVGDGFLLAWESVKSDIIAYVNSTFVEHGARFRQIWITGHSLGGALATLCTASLRFFYSESLILHLYTYACPRTGNESFVNAFNSLINVTSVRIANQGDVVPYLPPQRLGFEQVNLLTLLEHTRRDGVNCKTGAEQPPFPTDIFLYPLNHELVSYQNLIRLCV